MSGFLKCITSEGIFSFIRYQIILEFHNKIHSFFTSRFSESGFLKKVQLQDIFYEDTIKSTNEIISRNTIDNLSLEIKKAFHSLNNISLKKIQKKQLGSYLIKDTKISILDFYEKIYLKNHKSFILENSAIYEFEIILSRIKEQIEKIIQISLDPIDISIFYNESYNEYKNIPFGAYIQTCNNEFDTVVLNNFSNGFGSNISRFLNFLPDEFAINVMDYNEKLFPNTLLVELKDASIHNVNTFPQLTKNLLHLCDDNILNKTNNSISFSDVYITLDEHGEIILTNQDNLILKLISFSLEGINRRSMFFKFVDLFNDVDNFGFFYLLEKINDHFNNKLSIDIDIVALPRLKFGDKIIIQRKKWFVKKGFLTNLLDEKNKTLDEIFINLNLFVKENFIPKEVFFTIAKRNASNSQDDNYKPQYIDFSSPIFMLLLLSLIHKADDVIEITEMFPTSQDIILNGGIVKEYILNCN